MNSTVQYIYFYKKKKNCPPSQKLHIKISAYTEDVHFYPVVLYTLVYCIMSQFEELRSGPS